MAWPNNYGRLWGQIPNTAGQVFWVSPSASYTVNGRAYAASDNHDGLSPERALRTINRAWDLVTANAGDVIVLLPGTHSPSASITADVAGVTMMGLPAGSGRGTKQRTTIGAVTGDETINVTAADIEIAYLTIIPVTQQEALDFSAAAHRLFIHHCYFDLNTPAAHTSTKGVVAGGAADAVIVSECVFDSDGAQGPAIDATATTRMRVEDNLFLCTAGSWAVAVQLGAATHAMQLDRNRFQCSGTVIGVPVDGSNVAAAGSLSASRNIFTSLVTAAGKSFDNFGSAIDLSENYDSGVGAGDGGALQTAIT